MQKLNEITSSISTKINYITGIDGLTAVYTQQGQTNNMYYVAKDHLGSITGLINPDGTVAAEYSYDPWGRRRNPTNWLDYAVSPFSIINRGYTGHEHLEFFGLINMNGRIYDPISARFTTPDPFVQDPAFSQDFNRYSYVNNNPMRYTDPSGYHSIGDNGFYANWLRATQMIEQGHANWNNLFGGNVKNWLTTPGGMGGGNYTFATGFGGPGVSMSNFGLTGNELNATQLAQISNITGVEIKSGQPGYWVEWTSFVYGPTQAGFLPETIKYAKFVPFGDGGNDVASNNPIIPGSYDNSFDNFGEQMRNLERSFDGHYNGTGLPPTLFRILFSVVTPVGYINAGVTVYTGHDVYNRDRNSFFERFIISPIELLTPALPEGTYKNIIELYTNTHKVTNEAVEP